MDAHLITSFQVSLLVPFGKDSGSLVSLWPLNMQVSNGKESNDIVGKWKTLVPQEPLLFKGLSLMNTNLK